MDDEDILDDIINKEYSIYVEDEEGNYYYLYPTTDTVSDFTVSEPAITVDSSEHLLIDYDVTMTITSGMYFYSVEGTVEYSFWIDGGSEDLYYNYGDYTLVSREIDPEIGDALSDEQMITDFDSCEFAIGSDGYVVSSADFVDYNFEDIYFGSDYASRYSKCSMVYRLSTMHTFTMIMTEAHIHLISTLATTTTTMRQHIQTMCSVHGQAAWLKHTTMITARISHQSTL